MKKRLKLKGTVITPEGTVKNGEVCFENGRITYAGMSRNNDADYDTADWGECYISPGFIDTHVHGGGGFDFTDGTEEAFRGAARFHASHGTAVMLPTTLSCPDEELFSLIDVFERVRGCSEDGACIAGLHIEGPYCSVAYKGAQDEKYIRNPSPDHYLKILGRTDGIRRWTVAPELDGADEFIRTATSRGVSVSIGHSDAYYEDALRAFDCGCRLMTHFYSGMSSMRRIGGFRYPGLTEAGYMIDDMCVELIADGCHLPASMLNYIYRAKGAKRIVLCTDAMRCAGQSSGTGFLGSKENGLEVLIEDGVAKMPDRTAFAGSIATTDRLVRTMCFDAGVPLTDCIRMITEVPARLTGLSNKGLIAEGFDADITVFDADINVRAVYSGGRKVYEQL